MLDLVLLELLDCMLRLRVQVEGEMTPSEAEFMTLQESQCKLLRTLGGEKDKNRTEGKGRRCCLGAELIFVETTGSKIPKKIFKQINSCL